LRVSARAYGRLHALLLLALAMALLIPAPVCAGIATPPKVPPEEHQVVLGSDWLNGHGVEVYYPPHWYDDHPQNPDGTIQYECVELVIRLYANLGYTETWPIHWAYEIASIPGRKGFQDWAFTRNVAVAPPQRGDIVVWPSWYNGGTGHVGVVNLITEREDGMWVQIVHQNVWRGNTPRPLSEIMLQQDARGRFILIGKDGVRPLGWVHSPRMEAWLQQAPAAVEVASR
jgi:hypothetical protein